MPIFPEDISNQLGGGGELPSIKRLSPAYTGAPQQTKIPSYFEPGTPGRGGREAVSYDEIVKALSLKQRPLSATQTQISANELLGNNRYSLYRPGVNWEDIYGQNQSTWDKAVNGILKGTNLTATTILGSFGVLGGALISPFTGRLADIWDNKYLNNLDEWNTKVDQEYLPNFYTNAEKNAAWYSKDNWFTANFLFDKLIKNSGYAVGALISGNMVNAALLGAGARAGAAAMNLANAAEASQAFRTFTPVLRSTARAFSIGKNIEAAAVLEGEISSMADLTAKSSRLAQIANETNTFAKFGDLGRRVAVAAYSQAGESGFEALQTSKEFRNNLIEEYKNTHLGQEPTGEELQKINSYAEAVGKKSFFTNLALLSVTEYAQLDYLLGSSYRTSRQAANNLLRKTDDVLLKDGKYVVEAPTTRFGKLYDRVTGVGRYFFDPKEAFQELAQYATQIGTQNYYNKAYQGDEADVLLDGILYGFMGKDKRGVDVGALVSKEGMESMVLGGLTGGLMQAMGKYTETNAVKGNTQKFINELNNAPTFRDALKDKINSVNRGVVLQQQHRDAILQDDKLEATDLKTDLTHNYLAPRIKYGRTDMIKGDIADLRMTASTEGGLSTLKDQGVANINDTIPTFIERLDEFSKSVDTASSIYESLYQRYGGRVLQDGKTPAYPDEVLDKMTYAAVKVADYDVRIPSLNNALFAAGVNASELLESAASKKGVDKEIEEKTFAQIQALSVTDDAKESLKTVLEDVVELTKRRTLFLDEYNDMKDNPLKYSGKPVTPAVPTTDETITVKTKDGEEKIVVGERYVGGAKEIETEEGITINRFSEFDVMGMNEDGKIVLKTLDGKIHNVSPKAFEEYRLSRSADIGRNAKFYIDNSDKIFNYRFKGGKESSGRVVYDKKTKGLFFESIDTKKNGKPLYRIPVNLKQFEAQEGYSRAQIWSKEKFSEKTNDLLKQASTAEEAEIAANLEQKLNARRAIIKEITDDAKEQIEAIDKKIVEKKDELVKINQELEEFRAGEVKVAEARTKREKALEAKYPELSRQKAKFAKVFSKTSRALLKLARLKETLESEIADLQAQKEILEANTAYFQDFLQNVQELPENTFDLVDELKEQVGNLKALTESTGNQIVQFSKMIDDITETLRDLTEWLKDSLRKFDANYPAEIRERAEQIIASKTISFTEVNALKDAVADYALLEDLNKEITVNQEKLDDITSKLKNLINNLDDIGKEQRAKELILKRFEDIVQKELQRIKEEKAITKDTAVINQILGTLNQGIENREYDRTYEPDPKMSAVAAATSTTAPTERSFTTTKENVAEHHGRANRFGARMPNLSNANEIKGVIVTSETESQILNGLTNHLKQGKEEIDSTKTIALVMAIPSKDGKSYTLVDENGAPITEKSEAESDLDYQNRLLNTAIYQTFPVNIETRFRESVPQEVRMQLVNSYEDWRKEKLADKTLKNYDIRPSFGFTEKVQKPTENGLGFENDYNARVAVQESGLIRETELGSRRLVYVPTVEQTISLGSTAFGNALGRTFLVTKNGYVPLDNRQHTAEEAEVIHQVLVRLSEIIAEENTKGKFVYDNSPDAQRLINWLRSVTYWGTPKEVAGFNSVWFQKTDDGLKLFMSGKVNEEGKYTPICEFGGTALNENKGIIVGALQRMYQNTNAKATDENYYNERYEQITGVNGDGSVNFVMWPNYQTYLLSNKNADGTGTRKDIPLTTPIRPLKDTEDVNKYGIYFTIAENNIDKRFTDIAPEGKAITIKPAGTPIPKGKFTLDGKTENSIQMKNGILRFTADATDPEATITILSTTDESLTNFLAKQQEDAGKVADMEVILNTLAAYALGEVRKDLTAAAEKAKAPVPTAPAGKFQLDGKTENTITLKNGSFKFTAEKNDLEGTMVVTSADDNLVNSLIEAQIANGNPSDRDVIINTLGQFAVNEAKKDLASLAQAAPVASVEEAKPAEAPTVTKDEEQQLNDAWNATEGTPDDPEEYRVVLDDGYLETEDFAKFEEFLKKAFPILPVYRVKNMMRNGNGVRAMGMFKKAGIYLWESAEIGTGYHEVFEAVWKMFTTPKEQQSIRDEFRNRAGQFKDRPSGQMIKYSEATDQQIKEQLAEEFRSYIKDGVIPPKPVKAKPFILKLFADIWSAIKTFIIGPSAQSNTEKLFEKINKGYYKRYTQLDAPLAYANVGIIDIENATITDDAELSEIPGLTASEVHDFMQQMTFLSVGYLTRDNKNLFNISSDLKKTDVYGKVQANLRERFKKIANTEKERVKNRETTQEAADLKEAEMRSLFNKMLLNWDALTEAHEIYLRKYGIEFDENDEMNAKDENRSNRGEYEGAHKVDHFRKMNSAVRLVLATMPILDNNGNAVLSSIGGVKLIPVGETYISIMNRVHDSVDADDMMDRIREMAKEDTNYETLYRRLAKTSSDNLPNWDGMEAADIQLITAFSTQFTKQNPDVKILNILPTGGIQVGEANLTAASRQLEKDYVNGIKTVAMRPSNKFFEYIPKENAYVAKKGAFDKVSLTDNPKTYVKFLDDIGIEFSLDDINHLAVTDGVQYRRFREATAGILKSLKERKKIVSFSDQALDIKGRLLTLGGIQARITNPEFSSTFFGISGERLQTFIGTNPSFDLYKELSKFPTYQSLSGHPRFGYLYTDSFAQNSVVLNAIFNIDKATKTGDRRQRVDSKELMKPGIANGTNDQMDGKKKESSNLNFKERLVQEINMNLEGYYYNLVAGDAALEYMTYMGNEVKKEDLDPGKTIVQDIFKGYLIDEINLAREDRPTVVEKNKDKLRFMDAILGSELANKITADKTSTPEKIYNDNINEIQKAVDNYIKTSTESFQKLLEQYGIIEQESNGNFTVNNLAFAKAEEVSVEALDRNLKTLTINYMIANIEFHKLLYSDPYMYSDELKRIKNFLSPRQAIVSSGSVNAVLERVMNEGYEKGIDPKTGQPKDIGYTDMTKTYFKSATIEEIKGIIDLEKYDSWDEADGAGIINFKAHRNLRKRSNNWTDADEAQYRYDVAWEKQYKKLFVSKTEQKILDKGNPHVKSAYTPVKPIVAGSKADGKSYNDVMLDKLALFPQSYRVAVEMAELAGQETSNAVRLYDKMQTEGLDYVVFKSARKVGGIVTNAIYDDGGMVTKDPFKGVINVPFNIISIQTDVPSKEDNLVTRGSQMTKLVTMDFMEAGVPIDFELKDKNGRIVEDFDKRMEAWYALPSDTERKKNSELYTEIKNNEALLNALTEEGYKLVLKKLGITEKDGKVKVTDFSKAAKTFRDEMFKREVNSNIIKTLADFLDGKAILEATPAYQQVRNILYSIIDKNIASPKMSGGQKVQAPSTFLENIRAEKEKGGYSSDVLKFYKNNDGERVCEIMVSRWFDSPLSDKELMDYFNNTEEGKKEMAAIFGAAYRIPTGKQNYIEHFKIKQFLPREMADTVIVPSALVKKVGSDFDIDKLNVYLKNVYIKNGKPKMIPFFGIGEEARQKLQKTILKEDLEGIFKLDQEFPEVYDVSYEALYKKSLENAYIESLEKLISNKRNFEQLTTPNSSDELKGLSQKITRKLGIKPFESATVGDILDRGFMSRLRQAFVTGKYAIGIAAVAQTSHSLSQRQPTFVDTRKLGNLTERDRPWIGDGELKFEKFNKIKIGGRFFTSLSGIKNASGKYISDIIGQFIDGYVDISKGPWIIELGANPNVAGTFLFLAKAGVPADTLSYFMNQPIIRDYLRSLENAGQSYLFIDDNVDDVKSKYKTTKGQLEKITSIPSTGKLFENIGKTEFDAQENAEQQFILDEFLKYSKLAEQLLMVQQGINYDTSTLNDPLLVFKKNELYKRAQKSLISSAKEIMKNSFMGDLRKYINKAKEAVSQFLVSDRGDIQTVLENVLSEYIMLNDRDFLKVAKKAVSDFFDWAVQLSGEPSRNTFIQSLLLSDKNAASQVLAFKNEIAQDEKHPLYNNYIVGKNGILQTITPNKANGVSNISVKNKDNKAYDQDQVIHSFRELRDHLNSVGNLQLYKKIVGVSILQSGLSVTPYSFTSLLPYEDFMEIYNDAIYKMDMGSDLDLNKFYELGVFQRNNWANEDIVPQQRAKFSGFTIEGLPIYNTNMNFGKVKGVHDAINQGIVPKLLKMSTLSNAGRHDFVSYSWEKVPEGKSKAQMRKEGDFSYIKRALFKKVYYDKERTKPVITGFTKKLPDGTTKTFNSYVYQMVNAWGDSFRANEFYDAVRESVIENGYEKVTAGQYQVVGSYAGETYEVDMYTSPERDDQAVARLFGSTPIEPIAGTNPQYPGKPEFNKLPGKSATPTMTYAGIGSRETPQNILNEMTAFAKEAEAMGYILNTGVTFKGKEEGADAAFSKGTTKKNLFAPEKATEKEVAIAKEIHPKPSALSPGAMKLMARNTNQVFGANLNTPVDFVLFYAKETRGIRPEGGTGQAVQMARMKNIPTINMANPDWKEQALAIISGRTVPNKIAPKGLPSIDDENQNSCK